MSEPNPYSVSMPASAQGLFYGREDELQRVRRGVIASTPTHYSIIGGSGMGKSSFLRELQSRLSTVDDQATVFLAVDANEFDVSSLDTVLSSLHHRLQSEVLSQLGSDAPQLPDPGDPLTPVDRLEALVRSIVDRDAAVKVVIAIDNMNRLREHMNILGRQLAILINGSRVARKVALLLFGTPHFFTNVDYTVSPLAVVMKPLPLQNLSPDATMALIQEPVGGRVPEQVAELIVRETGGHPFLAQYILEELFRQTEGEVQTATVEQVELIESEFSRRPHLSRWFGRLTPLEQEIYAHFIEEERFTDRNLFKMGLVVKGELPPRAEGERARRAEPADIRIALDTLQTSGFIRLVALEPSRRNYELSGQLCARYFRENYLDSQSDPVKETIALPSDLL